MNPSQYFIQSLLIVLLLSNLDFPLDLIPTNLLLELDITLVFHECGVPWHILMLRQLCIELGMCVAINGHPLKRAVLLPLIGIKESSEPNASETVYAKLFLKNSPKTLGQVQRIGKADPGCRSRLTHS